MAGPRRGALECCHEWHSATRGPPWLCCLNAEVSPARETRLMPECRVFWSRPRTETLSRRVDAATEFFGREVTVSEWKGVALGQEPQEDSGP